MTPYKQHVEKWRHCDLCPLACGRRHVTFARGPIPCDVLFVGEAPGESEDVLGQPFVGPAGKLLDELVALAFDSLYTTPENRGWDKLRVCFYNLVGCFPREAKKTGDHQPPKEAIEACLPKLEEFLAIARPKLVVAVGQLAERWVPKLVDLDRMTSITHPAAILRANPVSQPLMRKKVVITLQDAVAEMNERS